MKKAKINENVTKEVKLPKETVVNLNNMNMIDYRVGRNKQTN
jgi:hypothetical protein